MVAKFNQMQSPTNKPDATVNEEGALAYKMAPELELYQRATTCLINEPKFYGDTTNDLLEVARDVANKEPEYVLQLAAYARNELYLRSTPLVLLVEMANHPKHKGKGLIRKWALEIIQRADELTEAISCQLYAYGKPIPNSLKKALADVFFKFDEYQLAKYKRDKHQISLHDVVNLIHPAPNTKEEEKLLEKVVTGNLKTPETWETQLTQKGSSKESWEEIIPKMGYMALIRNLRNFLQNDVNLDPVIRKISDKNRVLNSKQMPFRFYTAYKQIQQEPHTESTKVLDALEEAMKHAVENIPKLDGKTFLAADHSGSMQFSRISRNSSMTMKELGDSLIAMAHGFCEEAITTVFSDEIETVNLSKHGSPLQNMNIVSNTLDGGGTDGWLTIQYLIDNNVYVDRIMIFTDEQMYDTGRRTPMWERERSLNELFNKYKQQINPNVKMYLFDLQGYGTTQIPESDGSVIMIAGWSEKVFKFIELFEEGNKDIVEEIKSLSPSGR